MAGGLAGAGERLAMHYAEGHLSVHLEQVPLSDVLAALAAETGATIRGDILEPRDVTKRFDDLPIDRAIDRLLGRQNFTLRFGPDGRLLVIALRGMPVEPGKAPNRPGRPPNLHRSVPLTGPLRAALGRSQVPLTRLFDAAARQPEAAVRGAAIRLIVTTIESDVALRDAFVAMDDTALAALFRAQAGARAAEVASGMVGAARSFALRAKATRLMQQLRRPITASRVG